MTDQIFTSLCTACMGARRRTYWNATLQREEFDTCRACQGEGVIHTTEPDQEPALQALEAT